MWSFVWEQHGSIFSHYMKETLWSFFAGFSGTSNWSGDYFISTGGVAIIVNQTEALSQNRTASAPYPALLQEQLAAIFERDWNSTYAHKIKERPRRRHLSHNENQPEMWISEPTKS